MEHVLELLHFRILVVSILSKLVYLFGKLILNLLALILLPSFKLCHLVCLVCKLFLEDSSLLLEGGLFLLKIGL